MKNPGEHWLQRVQAIRKRAMTSPHATSVPAVWLTMDFHKEDEGYGEESFWPLVHPRVAEVAFPRFRSRYYQEAVECSIKVVTQQIRDRTGLDLDGVVLMQTALSPHNPHLAFDSLDTKTGQSTQQGYMQMFVGTILAVRNPKAHGIVEIDAQRCVHLLFLVSLLACKVDDALDVPRPASPNHP